MDWGLVAWVLGAALLTAVGIPTVFLASADWTWSEQDAVARRRILRTMLQTGAMFGAIGLVVAAVLAAMTRIGWVSALGTGLLAAGLTVWNLRVSAPVNRLHTLGRQLHDARKRPGARAGILALAEEAPDTQVGTTIRLGAATVLSNAGLHREAYGILQGMSVEGLDAHERELHALGVLDCLIDLHDLPAARAAMAKVPPLEPGSLHAGAFANMEALLLVLEGNPDAALVRISAPVAHPKVERGRQGVLAHAHAARGDDTSRDACLTWLRDNHGSDALQRVVDQNGPASWFARELLKGGGMPYRG